MPKLTEYITISKDEKPFIDFESSIDNDKVISGYVPVKSTLDVLDFLGGATAAQSREGRAVICWGSYGTGKSRLCSVLARLFRDGFDCPALQPIWQRLKARGESANLDTLRQSLVPAGRPWRPWLVVPMYAGAGGGTLSACLVRSLIKALRQRGMDMSVLGKETVYHAAVRRLDAMIKDGAKYAGEGGSTYATAEQLKRALEEDFDQKALEEFKAFHKKATLGVEFEAYVRASGDVAIEAYEVFNAASSNIQSHGYDGILILWDEFGFAIEELLRDGLKGTRQIGQEAIDLQNFLEKSCGTNELGKKVVFLGFTHVAISEYGTREGLDSNTLRRLETVSDRFRDPSINVRLGLTETEGYHLLAGMTLRTPAGMSVLQNPIPKLQSIAERMPRHKIWRALAPETCYNEIVSPCYPMHPAAAISLLVLSNQIAQQNRTTFYFLQNSQEGGLLHHLETTEAPAMTDVGGDELLRVPALFDFFEQSIAENKRPLHEQYRESLALFPDANELEIQLLQAVLVLLVIASPELSPTTDFLCFCFCDSTRDEVKAKRVHEALNRLSQANALWRNDATDVWSFVGGRGVNSEIDRKLSEERDLIKLENPAALICKYPQVQAELTDRIGDFDLDPSDSGIVRRYGVSILDLTKGEEELTEVNPAKDGSRAAWRSAMVYLVAADNAVTLETWRKKAAELDKPNLCLVFPPRPLAMDPERIRDLIAVQNLQAKTTKDDHAYDVLEGKLSNLRTILSKEFNDLFGNPGLRTGTEIVVSGPEAKALEVTSWNEFLTSLLASTDKVFPCQVRVRCGRFNEWQVSTAWGSAIDNIVERIINFDSDNRFQAEYLGFEESSQEAAIVDGVLLENKFLKQNAVTDKWELIAVDDACPNSALREIAKYLKSGGMGGTDLLPLFSKLVEPPFGIPNGVLPLLIALVFRTDFSRIGVFYQAGGQPQKVSDARTAEAIVDMAKSPGKYTTRYTKLAGKQRVVFKAVGPRMRYPFTSDMTHGERFYDYCHQVRGGLVAWAKQFPEGILNLPDLTEKQKRFLRSIRNPVPPHISMLADLLVEIILEDKEASKDFIDSNLQEYPAIAAFWNMFKAKLERYVDGVKAPVRVKLRDMVGLEVSALTTSAERKEVNEKIISVMTDLKEDLRASDASPIQKVIDVLQDTNSTGDLTEKMAAAVSDKPISSLTEEDFGRAVGVLEMVTLLRKEKEAGDTYAVTLPTGEKKVLPAYDDDRVRQDVLENIRKWLNVSPISRDQLAYLVLGAIYTDPPQQASEQSGA